jgi:DNA polymerase III subunit gamma/tau
MTGALYRKYRPQSFDAVKGQDHIVAVLSAALEKAQVGHAYLFSGSRGTGKTSVARIFAKALGIGEQDTYELDAASNRGIDDVRALKEGVHTMPFSSPYKIYIIDEVHMLTKEAFNALLKTLEEPPAHVIFILATTELAKLPETIVSRCEVHIFKTPTRALLREHMIRIANEEGYELLPDAADLIALLADGSFRDAHGVLQKVITVAPEKTVKGEHVAKVTGAPTGERINEIITAIRTNDAGRALSTIASAREEGSDMKVFGRLLMEKMRAILLLRFAPSMKEQLALEYTPDDIEFLDAAAQEKGSPINSALLSRLIDAYALLDRSAIPGLPLELALLETIKTE